MASEQAAEKRTRAKGEYIVEMYDEGVGGFRRMTGTGSERGSTADALRDVRKLGEGQYRVIRVCWSGEVKKETKTITRLT